MYKDNEIEPEYHDDFESEDLGDDDEDDEWNDLPSEDFCMCCNYLDQATEQCDGCGTPLCDFHYSSGGCYCLRPGYGEPYVPSRREVLLDYWNRLWLWVHKVFRIRRRQEPDDDGIPF